VKITLLRVTIVDVHLIRRQLLIYYPKKHNKKNEKELNAYIKYINNSKIWHKSIMT